MDNLFYLVFHRVRNWAKFVILIPLVSFSADVEILDAIGDVRNEIADNGLVLDSIDATLLDILPDIKTASVNTASRTSSILSVLQDVSQVLLTSWDGVGEIFTQDQQLHYDLNNFRSDFRAFASQNTNQLDAANDKLADIISSVNNLTNYLCTSPAYASFIDSIYTNLPALLLSGYYGSYSLGDQMSTFDFRQILQNLLGRNATMDEIQRFRELVTRFGSGRTYLTDFFSQVPKESDNPFIEKYEDLYIGPVSGISKAQFDSLQEMAQLRNYYYGTRPLLQFFEQATNDYPITQALITDPGEDGHAKSRFTSGFSDAVGSLASSFVPNISTNIASVNTNNISDVSYNNISKAYDDAKKESPDDSPLQDLISTVNDYSVLDDFGQALSDSSDVTLSFTIPGFFSASSSEVQIPLTPVRNKLGFVFVFMFRFLKGVLFIVTCQKCYSYVVQNGNVKET